MAWKWICISLKSWIVSWYKNEIVRADVSNCMCQCHNFLVLNVHIPAYMGSMGKPFFRNFEVFLLCLPIVDQYKFVYTNLYYTSSHTLIKCVNLFFIQFCMHGFVCMNLCILICIWKSNFTHTNLYIQIHIRIHIVFHIQINIIYEFIHINSYIRNRIKTNLHI